MHAVDDSDAVRAADGGEAVGDDDAGFALAKGVQAVLDLPLGDAVEGGSCLVQDQDGRILEEDSRDGDALLLPA